MTFVSKQVSGDINISINKALLCTFILHRFSIEQELAEYKCKDLLRRHVGMLVECRSVSVQESPSATA